MSMSDKEMAADPPPSLPEGVLRKDELRILVLADMHIPLGESRFKALLEWDSFLKGHDIAVLLGDATAFYGTEGEYSRLASLIKRLPLRYSAVNGNHEFSFLPIPDESEQYGKIWELSSIETQRSHLLRFERFFGLGSRFNAFSAASAEMIFLGVDSIEKGSTGALLDKSHEDWLEERLAASLGRPLLVFCHFPLYDERLEKIKYYDPARQPCYKPPERIRAALRAKPLASFWISGHVHFNPGHPLARPYETVDGVWQLHCPDGFGFGRKCDAWLPSKHEDFHLHSLFLSKDGLEHRTFDVFKRKELSGEEFNAKFKRGA